MKANKSSKPISKYEENLSILNREVTNYKHANFKKETRKIIKTKHFLAYFESCNNSFMNTPLHLLWNFNYLTPKFLKDIEIIEYDDIIPPIIQLLTGDFKNTKKKRKFVDLRKPNQKICSFYFLPLKNNSNDNILFCLCLKGKNSPSSSIYFLSISRNWDFEEIGQEFLNKINNDDDNFPLVEFDKNGIYLVDEILFSHKEIDEISGNIICYPLKNIDMSNNKIFDKQLVHKKLVLIYNDESDFKDNQLNESIIKQIEDNQYEQKIISAINGEFWNYKLSQQERKYVINSDSFILSGRPGTGKTTVILFKVFSIYFNYKIKKKFRLLDKENISTNNNLINISNNKMYNINNNNNNILKINNTKILNNKPTESLRVVFTSLSQTLCEKQQNILEETMIRKIDDPDFNYYPISNNKLKLISSFRNLNEYPIFANFRKIMFMIDGSLTFQFFSRHNLMNYEGDYDTEYFYSKDYLYDVNKYSNNENYKYINFFYRSPNFKNVVQLQESNENTFITFYKNFLSKRKTIPLAQTLFALNLNPLEIYAQLISIIKGSYSSHLYMNNCISKEDYKAKGRKITDLPNLEEIYDICMIYEDYKKDKYFDIQDLVNFLIRQVKLEFKDVKLIDYLFIDEIQDLSVSQIYLLILVSKFCKVYAGDTCQTISKIHRFRFSELNNIFYNFGKIIPNYPKVNNAYLCLNYRLNSKILRLSTFMAYLIRLLFPNTIDKFQDDFSLKIIDQKPIILKNLNLIIDNIKNIKNKDEIKNNKIKEENNYYKKNNDNKINDENEEEEDEDDDYTLAANHCFIYNSEKDGEELNKLYGDSIYKLNVEETKGLEFEMVIVYNFFSSSKFQGLWNKIFKNININNEFNDSINQSSKIQLRNILCQENINVLLETLNLKKIYPSYSPDKSGQIEEKIINELNDFVYPNCLNYNYDIHEIFEFCSELKQFYVIITRPKTFLVFYETNLNKERSGFYELMKSKKINLIVSEDSISQKEFLENVSKYFENINLTVKSPKKLRILGNDEFNEGHYSRATYLYNLGNHTLLKLISEVFCNEEILDEKISIYGENSQEINYYNKNIINSITSIIKEIEKNEKNLEVIFGNDKNRINIEKTFEKMIDLKAKSLIYLKRYDESIELYKKYNNKYHKENQLGMIYYKYKENYQLAFKCFELVKNYKYALNSLIEMRDYSMVFDYTNKIASYLGIIRFNDIYIKYTNFFFRIYFF